GEPRWRCQIAGPAVRWCNRTSCSCRGDCLSRGGEISVGELEGEDSAPGGYRHYLPSLLQERDGTGSNSASKIHAPQLFAALRVKREKVTLVAPSENQLSGRRQHSCPRLGVQLVIPNLLSGLRIERPDCAPAGILRQIDFRHTPYVPVSRAV